MMQFCAHVHRIVHNEGILTMQRTRAPKIAAVALAALLATPLLGGCNASNQASDDGTDAAASGQAATGESDADAAEGASDSTDASSEDGSDDSASPSFSYSTYLDDEGHWQGVTALDYVTLCDYKNIPVPSDEVVPTDDEVQEQIDGLAASFATTEQVTDRAVEDGDAVNIDYVGTIDGEEFDGGSTNGAGTTVTIGVTQYIDDFLEQLVGHMPGETFDVEVTFPDDYGVDELNGKDAVFSVTINYISETVTPEITDEWVSENLSSTYGWTTVDEMRQAIADSLQTTAVANYVQDYVTENSEVSTVPEIIVTSQEQLLVAQYQSYADSFGMDLSDMLSMAAGVETPEELFEQNREALDLTAKAYLVYQAIAEDAGIEVSEDDVLAYFQSAMGVTDLTDLEEQYGMPYLKLCALVQAVQDLLVDGAVIE